MPARGPLTTAILVRLALLRASAHRSPARPVQRAPDERQIAALQPAVGAVGGELPSEPRVRLVRLGHHQQTGRVLVEPVHDTRPLDAADAGEARPAMGDEGIDQRACGVTGPGMDGEASRLVDDDEVRVLVHHGERDCLGLRAAGVGAGTSTV